MKTAVLTTTVALAFVAVAATSAQATVPGEILAAGLNYLTPVVVASPGETVTFRNLDPATVFHSVTSGVLWPNGDGNFNSGLIAGGTTTTFTAPTTPGAYPFLCTNLHPNMRGTLVVT